jgi:hypothetical protein
MVLKNTKNNVENTYSKSYIGDTILDFDVLDMFIYIYIYIYIYLFIYCDSHIEGLILLLVNKLGFRSFCNKKKTFK